MMEKNVIDLFTLQTEVRQSLESSFPARVWVRAEVSAVKVRGGGHCYLELSQSDESGLVAKASAIIWASRFRVLGPYFESVAGSPLQPGITVLLRVQVNYSQLYGLSLIVDDIDASCTLGEKEKERLATIERLKKEGLLDRQKSLEMTALPYRLAVVSAPDAAGYRDFERHLKGNAYGFVLETVLYEAVMQGASAPESISDALKAAASAEKPFDAVLVLRGGGSNLDLSCFDDYSLASAIATCPVPILTAVGHDQDFHICDMVAWRYVKTPTALADTFIEIYADEDQYISSFAGRLKTAFLNKISLMGSRVDVLESRIAGADPRRILSRGYALVVDDGGVVMKNAAGHSAGDNVKVMFADGTLDCRVTGIQLKQEDNDGRV
ncbi:MAG: exodeoxyribonuclease VII large subunit [Candidatus Cryptobacteroides sp.]|nr:exodeoxyribonuclease VII large subunit [Bacteroidales bacterium]MDY5495971.1 exodeoxyribonuclease VII large subunit [Candidatus Cryptobacteroides sp.]